jgi:tetratricopeptide (TPR) repeat protein
MATVAETLALALKRHREGDLQQAEWMYRQILAAQPGHVDALQLLGLVFHQVGRNDLAVEYIGAALRLKPDYAVPHNNLGIALFELGRLEEAAARYRRALAGALGAAVWIALPRVPDWRWLLDREDCPWYPTARLIRQRRFGDWEEVFARIADALRLRAS